MDLDERIQDNHLNSHQTIQKAHEIKKVYKKRYDYELSITAQKQSNNIQMHKYRIDNSLIRSIGFETKWNLKTGINDFFHFLENNNI